MSTTDVHRMLDNKLPKDRKCEGVTMMEVYSAVIDGQEFTVDVAPGTRPEDVADLVVAYFAPGSAANAQLEGAEVPWDDPANEPMLGTEAEPEYDDSDDDDEYEEDEDVDAPPKPKAKPKSKAKSRKK